MMPSLHMFVSLLYILKDLADIKCNEWINDPEIDRHLQLGRELLTQGLYNDALSHYHAAVDADPYNYVSYYTRATVYLAIGKIASALKDLTKVIELKPDFAAAQLQRGNIYLKQGFLDDAHVDLENVLRMDPMNSEANHGYNVIEPLRRDIQLVYSMVNDHNHHDAIVLLTDLLQELPWDSKLREMRSRCYESVGDIKSAISDLQMIVKLQSENQMRYLRLIKLNYEIGETEEALNAIRECLRYDPDDKACFSHYKNIKKIAGHLKAIQDFINEQNYADCISRAEKAIPLENKVPHIMFLLRSKLCICQNKAGQTVEAIKSCTDALKKKPDDVDILCERADAHLSNNEFSEAIQDFQKALNINERSHRANKGLRQAQKLEKQSKKRNYYAILGVKRTAGKREILKAYRKLAQKWHPDNFQDDEKAKAENKFIDIAAAKEVLTDPEKRQKFDNGEDPLDPESQQGSYPFPPGFNPFARGFS